MSILFENLLVKDYRQILKNKICVRSHTKHARKKLGTLENLGDFLMRKIGSLKQQFVSEYLKNQGNAPRAAIIVPTIKKHPFTQSLLSQGLFFMTEN